MKVEEWFFGFSRRAYFGEILSRKESLTTVFGHVEAWGYTVDGTWIFFDPRARRTEIQITHIYEEILDYGQERYQRCHTILKMPAREGLISYPLFRPHLHCVTQCSALVGLRAYTMSGFQSMLLKNGAEIIHGCPRGRSRGESRARETAETG